ncbi:trihelix transcription factor GTL1 isoform X2 [Brassica napus]|uniref:trihelix transcription factor GTL1 isoform X2 n=1 Tax=Brassica napus TaxID=3708 RepID=UPI00207A8173|nr:trihelix transcription factor GTL1 isoform X2 [Brassica napus]
MSCGFKSGLVNLEMEQGAGGGNEVVEEASPISSRPPANMEELMRFSAAADEGGGLGGGGSSASSSSGNRWPREETLALLRIRSEMDSTFRDATLKAPLWEHVSRKLLELGYKRSAKKCKEKFENVQKYYKRTKETRGGRHDGKAYKFFSQLEALNTTPPSSSLDATPLSVANPIQPPPSSSQFPVFPLPQTLPHSVSFTPNVAPPPPAPMGPTFPGVTFSSHSSSTASGMGSDDDDDEEDIMDVDQAGPSSRKRKRGNRGGGKMMELFDGLVRQVMQKQASMQRSFLEALEKREQERLHREEAWKRQEMSRLAREHEIMSQERAASASRDAAIISMIQKITGHTIQLAPSFSSQPSPPPRQPPPAAKRPSSQPVEPPQLQPIMAIPQQQVLPPPPQPPPQQEVTMSSDQSSPSSSRWPKAEILALINLRSGMEPRYQDNVPKGLLWEEISSSMKRMGYNRNAKRCKEKWENINKYYKKVKESNKERPQDAKTCPYFHRLDLLYRNKVLGSGGSSSASALPHQDQISTVQKQSPVSAVKPPQGVVTVGSASSEGEEPREESPQETEKKTL